MVSCFRTESLSTPRLALKQLLRGLFDIDCELVKLLGIVFFHIGSFTQKLDILFELLAVADTLGDDSFGLALNRRKELPAN